MNTTIRVVLHLKIDGGETISLFEDQARSVLDALKQHFEGGKKTPKPGSVLITKHPPFTIRIKPFKI